MSEVVTVSSQASRASDGFEALAHLNDGFLGTGYSTSVELSFIAMALIFGFVAIGTVRYFMPETRFFSAITDALGLRDS